MAEKCYYQNVQCVILKIKICQTNLKYEMLNKSSLVRVKFMSDVHLRKPEFRHSSCRPSTKNKQRIQKSVKKKKKIKDKFIKTN